MEMKVDRRLIRRARERRAWSQEHLAEVAGLGLRTIQRIEATGLASFESVKAIAAVLEMSASGLTSEVPATSYAPVGRPGLTKTALAIAASAVVAVSAFLVQSVFADDVMLNVGLTLNDQEQQAQLLTAEGEDAEIVVEGLFRLIILPTIRADGHVYLATQIYEADGRNYVLVSQPELATANDEAAEIRVSTDRGNAFTVMITPHVQ
jgi:transcriptional regulator with XRE-family HTH domain